LWFTHPLQQGCCTLFLRFLEGLYNHVSMNDYGLSFFQGFGCRVALLFVVLVSL
jgi:hypothetical protein